jgi:hypothetical protein
MSRKGKKLKSGAQVFNHGSNADNFECYIDPKVMLTLYTRPFSSGSSLAAEWHIIILIDFVGQ